MPDLSVVIPVGRVDEDLPLQFEALENQSYSGSWEIVLSLNSSDRKDRSELESLAAVFSKPEIQIIDSSDVRSASYARNVGAGKAKSEMLLFCDGDDIADPEWVLNLSKKVTENIAAGGHLGEDVLAISGQEGWRPAATPGSLPMFLDNPYLVSANMGLTKDLFFSVGGFKQDLIRGEDMAFSWDLIREGAELVYVPDAVIHYRHRRGLRPMLKQHYLYGRGMSQILARYGLPNSVTNSNKGSSLSQLKPNNQSVGKKSAVHYLRRGSIAMGRLQGLVQEKFN